MFDSNQWRDLISERYAHTDKKKIHTGRKVSSIFFFSRFISNLVQERIYTAKLICSDHSVLSHHFSANYTVERKQQFQVSIRLVYQPFLDFTRQMASTTCKQQEILWKMRLHWPQKITEFSEPFLTNPSLLPPLREICQVVTLYDFRFTFMGKAWKYPECCLWII